jgi:hypothetical protein
MTNSVVPKNRLAVAVRRTPLDVVRTTGSRSVTPLTVCGNEDAAAFVSSASVTVSVNLGWGTIVAGPVAEGSGGTDRVGVALSAETVGFALGAGKATRDGTHPRITANTTRITTARNASRASEATP